MECIGQTTVRILLVEDDPSDVELVDQALRREYPGAYDILDVDSLSGALAALVDRSDAYDVILLDSNLSDASGTQGLTVISTVTGNMIPVIILSDGDDEVLAEQAIQLDAQDFMNKRLMTGAGLNRAIRYSVERHKTRLALEENRERFRQFARVASDRFWETDADHQYADTPGTLNDDLQPSRGILVGETPWNVPGFLPLNDGGWNSYKAHLENRDAIRNFDVVYSDDDGERTFWSISGEPVFKDKETFIGYRGTAANITKRKKAEEEIAAARATLEEMNARKDKFFSIIAHDLRSPFAGVLGTADLLRKGIIKADSEKLKEYGELMYAAAGRAFNLVEDLLEWSRLQLDSVSFQTEVFEVADLIAENMALVEAQAAQKNIDLRVDQNGGAAVLADRQAINAVIRNLVTNAVKFTEAGGVVSVDISKANGLAQIAVSDTGVGIPADKINKLFSIAENTSTVGTSGEKGTGLGLVLCHELVDKNGGTIDVDSIEGKGTTIRFTVPLGA